MSEAKHAFDADPKRPTLAIFPPNSELPEGFPLAISKADNLAEALKIVLGLGSGDTVALACPVTIVPHLRELREPLAFAMYKLNGPTIPVDASWNLSTASLKEVAIPNLMASRGEDKFVTDGAKPALKTSDIRTFADSAADRTDADWSADASGDDPATAES